MTSEDPALSGPGAGDISATAKELPRWEFLGDFVLLPVLSVCGFILAVWSLSAVPLNRLVWREPVVWLYPLSLAFIFVFAAVAPISIFKRWLRKYGDLRESEHYIILVILALYSAAAVACLNYVLYRIDTASFSVDEQVRKVVSFNKREELDKVLIASRQEIQELDGLVSEIAAKPVERFSVTSVQSVERSTFSIGVGVPQFRLILKPSRTVGFGGPGGIHEDPDRLEVELNGRTEMYLDPDDYPGSGEILSALFGGLPSVGKGDLLRAIEFRRDWELAHVEKPAEVAEGMADILPFRYFLYQALMEVVGGDAKYFLPISAVSSAVAFFYALAKFLYFGMLISVFSKHRLAGLT